MTGSEPVGTPGATTVAGTVHPGDLEPGAEIVVQGRRLTVAAVVPTRTGFDIAPTCGAPVHHEPAVDDPITWS